MLAACLLPTLAAAQSGSAATRYDIVLHLSPAQSRLEAVTEISGAQCTSGQLRLHLNRALTVTEVTVDGTLVPARFDPPDAEQFFVSRARTFDVPCPSANVRIHYTGSGDLASDGRNQVSPALIELSAYGAWYPIADIATPVIGRLRTELPPSWVWTTNATQACDAGTDSTRVLECEWTVPRPDFTLVASPYFARMPIRNMPIDVLPSDDVPEANRARAVRIGAAAAEAFRRYRAWMGIDPLREARAAIVFTRRGGPLSYARLPVIITQQSVLESEEDSVSRSPRLNILHELAHFWSRGSRAPQDDWINEGVAEFLAVRALRSIETESAYRHVMARYRRESAAAGDSISFVAPSRSTYVGRYVRPVLLFTQLDDEFGGRKMDRFLAALAHTHVGVTTEELAALGTAVFGEQIGTRIRRCATTTQQLRECGT